MEVEGLPIEIGGVVSSDSGMVGSEGFASGDIIMGRWFCGVVGLVEACGKISSYSLIHY